MSTDGNALPHERRETQERPLAPELHPAWANLIRFCRDMGHGEIERIKIQDGLPVIAELATRKIKFT